MNSTFFLRRYNNFGIFLWYERVYSQGEKIIQKQTSFPQGYFLWWVSHTHYGKDILI